MKLFMTPDAALLLQQAFGFLFFFAGLYAFFAYRVRRRYGLHFSPWLAMMLVTLGIPHILSGQTAFQEMVREGVWFHIGLLAMLLFPVGLWRLMETTIGPGPRQALRRCLQLQLLMVGLLWLPSALQLRSFDADSQFVGNIALSLQLAVALGVTLRHLRGDHPPHRWLALAFLLFSVAGLFDTLTALAGFHVGPELYPVAAVVLVLVVALSQERLLGETHRELLLHQQDLEALVRERTAALEIATRDAQSASRAKSEFLANMSHELRTPLNTMLGYAALIKGEAETASETARRAEIIHDSGGHLLQLLTDVLDLAKLEAGKSLVSTEACDLPAVVGGVADMLRPLADARGLRFEVHVADELPRTLETDPRRLRQILLNLLGNAFKFTERGHVDFRVYREAEQLVFEVEDSGPGIAPDDLKRIFDAFEQGPSAPGQDGSGLGLAISRKLAGQLGGELRVDSQPGQGSRFTLLLPIPEAPETVSSARSESLPVAFDTLRAAVDLGDVQAIRNELERLRQNLPRYADPLQDLARLADACDIQALQEKLQ